MSQRKRNCLHEDLFLLSALCEEILLFLILFCLFLSSILFYDFFNQVHFYLNAVGLGEMLFESEHLSTYEAEILQQRKLHSECQKVVISAPCCTHGTDALTGSALLPAAAQRFSAVWFPALYFPL